MKTKELKKAINDINLKYDMNLEIERDDDDLNIMSEDEYYACIKKTERYMFTTNYLPFSELKEDIRRDLLKIIYEFAQTPIDSRNLFPRFHISSKLTPNDFGRFLFKLAGSIDDLTWGEQDGKDSEFTQEEIDYICDKFHTNLSDFNIEEVEKWNIKNYKK